MKTQILVCALFGCFFTHLHAQKTAPDLFVDSALIAQDHRTFNGIVEITQSGKPIYLKTIGYADLSSKTPLTRDAEFVVGSISKLFTAVIVMREAEAGRLDLHAPVKRYLPEIAASWADSVTCEQLLTHMHGIVDDFSPSRFPAGSQFSYSQKGFELLSRIVEKTSGKSFQILSDELFAAAKMKHSFHPENIGYKKLVDGYTEQADSTMLPDSGSFQNYAAAGSFVSNAADLAAWNEALHSGKILKKESLEQMLEKYPSAVRDHPVFGPTNYGYGTTINEWNGIRYYGQTGYAPGYTCMNYYFPDQNISLVVLSNVAYAPDDLSTTFYHHKNILNALLHWLEKN